MAMELIAVSVLLVTVHFSGCAGSALQVIADDYCQSQMFKAECKPDEVILMRSAQYGRLNMGKCVAEDFGYVGQCVNSVLAEMDKLCSGKHSCELKVEDPTFPSAKPCHTDLKSYLSVSYSCIPVKVPPPSCRYLPDGPVINDSEGYISSLVSRETECGLTEKPWTIRLAASQTVNISIINFNAANSSAFTTSCRVFATIKDVGSPDVSKTVCGERKRQSKVFSSRTNTVEIRIMGNKQSKNEPEFLFYYQAIGCCEFVAPAGGWVKKLNDSAVIVGCDSDHRGWRLNCRGNQWIGHWSNCTAETTPFLNKVASEGSSTISAGISIGLVAGIAVIVGTFILITGIFCIRLKLRKASQRVPPVTTAVIMPPGSAVKPTAHPSSPPPHYPGDQGSRENEYASMRLLPPTPDSLYDKQTPRNNNQLHDGISLSTTYDRRRCQSPDHIYESPEPDRRTSSGSKPGLRTASPQYFDLDPRVMAVHAGAVMPTREGNYCTCYNQGQRGCHTECNKHSV